MLGRQSTIYNHNGDGKILVDHGRDKTLADEWRRFKDVFQLLGGHNLALREFKDAFLAVYYDDFEG